MLPITGSAKRHIPGLEAVAKVSGKPGLWLVAYTTKQIWGDSLL